MRFKPLSFILILAAAIAIPSRAAEKPSAAQGNQNQPKKVWTNDDMDQLHTKGLISVFNQVPEATTQTTTQTPAATSEPAPAPALATYTPRLEDPQWYADKAADLQAELDRRQAALQQQQMALAQAANRITQPGVSMDQPTIGVTPAAALAVLETQVNDVQSQLDELNDLARQNNIPPGDLRS